MSAPSRALAALTLAVAVLLPPAAAAGLPVEDTSPASGSTVASNGEPVVASALGASLPGIATRGWVVADLDTGEILAMRRPHEQLRPASTLKLLTALTVAPRHSPEQPYRAVAADETAEGNRVVLYEGLEYTIEDLLHAALLPSANDAAQALARANGGVDATLKQMNAEARRLGATNTTARNPSGLDADGQFTTAFDLAIIGRAAMLNPEIASYLELRSVDFPGEETADGRVIYPIYNLNRMLSDGYEGALGGKPGYTSKAGRTMVAAAERDGRRLVASLLRIGGNTYTTPEVLLDWAFANIDELTTVGQLPDPVEPAPQFDRTVVPLQDAGAEESELIAGVTQAETSDRPTAAARSWTPRLLGPSVLLTLLTLAAALLVGLRARVYWRLQQSRHQAAPTDTHGLPDPRAAVRLDQLERRPTGADDHDAAQDTLIGASR